MIIREYLEMDKDQVLQLHEEFIMEYFPEFTSKMSSSGEEDLEERYSYFLHQPGKFWVMDDQGLVIGLIGVQIQVDNRAELIQLRVRKSHQRKGVGSLLVKKVEEYAVSQGKGQIYLHTAEHLLNARKLYEKSGYILERSTQLSSSLEFTVMLYRKDLH